MKKIVAWAMTLMLAFSLTACSGNDTKTTAADTTAAESTEAATTAAETTAADTTAASSEAGTTAAATAAETASAEELAEFKEALAQYNALSAKEEHIQLSQILGEGTSAQTVNLDATVKQIGDGDAAQVEFGGTQINNGTSTDILLHYKDGVAYLSTGGQKIQVASSFASVQQMIGGKYISGIEDITYTSVAKEEQADGSVKLVLTVSASEEGIDSGIVELVIGSDGQIISLHALQEGSITSGTTSMKATVEMTVEVLNTNDAVKIDYPDFSDYVDSNASSNTTAAETTAEG